MDNRCGGRRAAQLAGTEGFEPLDPLLLDPEPAELPEPLEPDDEPESLEVFAPSDDDSAVLAAEPFVEAPFAGVPLDPEPVEDERLSVR